MSVNLIDAIVTYLRSAMAIELGDTPTVPRVFSDYAGDIPTPYGVVTDASETYEFQSGNPITYIADGTIQVIFFGTTKSQVLALGRSCILNIMQSELAGDAGFELTTGRLLELRPGMASSQVVTEITVGQPTVFARTVVFHYKEQFPVI